MVDAAGGFLPGFSRRLYGRLLKNQRGMAHMDIIILGQCLLGFLAVVAILVNLQLARLGRRQRRRKTPLPPLVASLLLWLPVLASVIVAGGGALGESSL